MSTNPDNRTISVKKETKADFNNAKNEEGMKSDSFMQKMLSIYRAHKARSTRRGNYAD